MHDMHRIAGHVTIDFAVLHDAHTMLRMWATDISVGPSPALAAFQLFDFLAAGDFDARRGVYALPNDTASTADTPTGPLRMPTAAGSTPDSSDHGSDGCSATSAPPLGPETPPAWSAVSDGAAPRHYVSCELLQHPLLPAVGYEPLLRAFRVAGAGFDVATRTGAALSLTDSAAAGTVGAVLAAADSPAAAMRRAVTVLELINETLVASVGPTRGTAPVDAVEVRSLIIALQYLAQQLDPPQQHT